MTARTEQYKEEATKYLDMCRILAAQLSLEEQADFFNALVDELANDRDIALYYVHRESSAA